MPTNSELIQPQKRPTCLGHWLRVPKMMRSGKLCFAWDFARMVRLDTRSDMTKYNVDPWWWYGPIAKPEGALE